MGPWAHPRSVLEEQTALETMNNRGKMASRSLLEADDPKSLAGESRLGGGGWDLLKPQSPHLSGPLLQPQDQKLGRKGFIWLTLPYPSPLLKEIFKSLHVCFVTVFPVCIRRGLLKWRTLVFPVLGQFEGNGGFQFLLRGSSRRRLCGWPAPGFLLFPPPEGWDHRYRSGAWLMMWTLLLT